MERGSKDNIFGANPDEEVEETPTLEQQFGQPLPDLEKLESRLERDDDEDFAPPGFGDQDARLEKVPDVVAPSEFNYALVSMVAPEGTPQKSSMMAFKIRGAFNTREEAEQHRTLLEVSDPAFAIWIIRMGEDIPFPPRSTTLGGQLEEQQETQDAYRRSNAEFIRKRDERIDTAKKGIDNPQDIKKIKEEANESFFQEMTLEPARIKKSVMKTKVVHEPEADPDSLRVKGQSFATVSILCHRLYNDPKLKDKYDGKDMRYLFRIVGIDDEEKDALQRAESANEKEEDHDFTIVELWDWAPFPPPPGGIRFMYRNKPEMQAKLDYLYATLEKRGNEVAGPTEWMNDRGERISHLMMNIPTPEELEEISRERVQKAEAEKMAEEVKEETVETVE